MKNSLAAIAVLLLLNGCLGYQIGPVKPHYLADINTIAVPTFKNDTLIPRIEVLVTDSVIKQFQQDGTFKIGNEGNSDAILKAEISRVARAPARSVRGNVLATTEFNLVMRVKYKLVGRDGKAIGPPGEAQGTTSFFIGNGGMTEVAETSAITGDVTSSEWQALPLAAEELADHLVSQLSEGW